jgi:O-acetyl-ADP-ribose deacetylase (regulator of RNase III)
LSTGAYGYPVELAARTALQAVCAFLREQEAPLEVRFVLFDAATQDVFVAALVALRAE